VEAQLASCPRCGAPEVGDEKIRDAVLDAELGLDMYAGTQRFGCLVCGYCWPLPPESLDSDVVQTALALAQEAHGGEARHPIEVAHLLWEEGYGDVVIAAALLHDAFDVACWDPNRVRTGTGDVVADLVDALTQDREIHDYEKRRLDLRARVCGAGHRAVAIYAAGRLSELRRLRADYAERGEAIAAPDDVPMETLLTSFDRDLRMLDRAAIMPPFRRPLGQELDALRDDRAAARREKRRRAL
jgi:hypothetical protein